jgi:hypothetical protein
MNNFDDENRIEKDEPVNAVGGNYNPDNNTGLENGDAAETSDITGEAAMENIRWGGSQNNMKRRGRGALSTALIGAILGSAITLGVTYIYLPDILDSRGIPPDSAPPQQHITQYQNIHIFYYDNYNICYIYYLNTLLNLLNQYSFHNPYL